MHLTIGRSIGTRKDLPNAATSRQRSETGAQRRPSSLDGTQALRAASDLGDEVPAQIFWSNRQVPRPATYFVIRTAGDPAMVTSVVVDRLRAVDADMQVSQVRTMRSA